MNYNVCVLSHFANHFLSSDLWRWLQTQVTQEEAGRGGGRLQTGCLLTSGIEPGAVSPYRRSAASHCSPPCGTMWTGSPGSGAGHCVSAWVQDTCGPGGCSPWGCWRTCPQWVGGWRFYSRCWGGTWPEGETGHLGGLWPKTEWSTCRH